MRKVEATIPIRADRRAGFTLIELTGALAIAAVVVTFLPAVQRLREATNRAQADQTLRAIGNDLEARLRKSGQLPGSLSEVITERKAGGYEFAAVVLTPNLARIVAEPIPGVTGSYSGFLEVGIGPAGVYKALNFAKTAGADEGRKRMYDDAYAASARAFGRIIELASLPDATSALKGVKADSENLARRNQVFDSLRGMDGKVGFASIVGRLGTVSSNGSLNQVLSELAQDFHRTFRLGANREDITTLPGASVPDAPEVTDRMLNFTRLARLTDSVVVDPNFITELQGFVRQAVAADAAGDTAARQKALATYSSLLENNTVRYFSWGMKAASTVGSVPIADANALIAVATALK